jgi:Holliday junction resolvase RusA-like endonuclease
MKIKTRKKHEEEYQKLYGDINNDAIERLIDYFGDRLDEDLIESAINRIESVQDKIEYHSIDITFYEKPIQSHRPRTRGFAPGMYVPNAKANHDAVEDFVHKLFSDMKIVSVPMRIELTAYHPMPVTANDLDVLLYEFKHDYAFTKPDFDNVIKAYSDMIQKTIILDDDMVCSCEFNKYYSLKPRVEMRIIYPNGYSSEHTYKKITSRISFKKVKDYVDVKLLVEPYKRKKKKV